MGRAEIIDVEPVLATGREIAINDDVRVPDFDSYVFPSPAWVEVALRRSGGELEIVGTIDVSYAGSCDRCLEDVRRILHLEVDERLMPKNDRDGPFAENNVLEGSHLDLADLVRQLIASALPLSLVCSDECRGLCPVCGLNRNSEACPHAS
jgi:uncharacterized protein